MSLTSGREMRFCVPPKTFRLDGWITQRIRQWFPNRRAGDCDDTVEYSVCDGWRLYCKTVTIRIKWPYKGTL